MSDWSDWGSTPAPTPTPNDAPPATTIQTQEDDYLPPDEYFYQRDLDSFDSWGQSKGQGGTTSAGSAPSSPAPASAPASGSGNPFEGLVKGSGAPGSSGGAVPPKQPETYEDLEALARDQSVDPAIRQEAALQLKAIEDDFNEGQETLVAQTEADLATIQRYAEANNWGEMSPEDQEHVMRGLSAILIVVESLAGQGDVEGAAELKSTVDSLSKMILNDIDDPDPGRIGGAIGSAAAEAAGKADPSESLWERYDVPKPDAPDLGDDIVFGLGKAIGTADALTGGALMKVLEVADVPSQLVLTGIRALTSGDAFGADYWTGNADVGRYDQDGDGSLNFREALGVDPEAGGRLLGAVDTAAVIATDPLTYMGLPPQVRAGLKTVEKTFGTEAMQAVRKQGMKALNDAQQQVLLKTLEEQAAESIASGAKRAGKNPVLDAQKIAADRLQTLTKGGRAGLKFNGRTAIPTGTPVRNAVGRIGKLLPEQLRGSLDAVAPRAAVRRVADQGAADKFGQATAAQRATSHRITEDVAARTTKLEKAALKEAKEKNYDLEEAAKSALTDGGPKVDELIEYLTEEGMTSSATYVRTLYDVFADLEGMKAGALEDLSKPLADPIAGLTRRTDMVPETSTKIGPAPEGSRQGITDQPNLFDAGRTIDDNLFSRFSRDKSLRSVEDVTLGPNRIPKGTRQAITGQDSLLPLPEKALPPVQGGLAGIEDFERLSRKLYDQAELFTDADLEDMYRALPIHEPLDALQRTTRLIEEIETRLGPMPADAKETLYRQGEMFSPDLKTLDAPIDDPTQRITRETTLRPVDRLELGQAPNLEGTRQGVSEQLNVFDTPVKPFEDTLSNELSRRADEAALRSSHGKLIQDFTKIQGTDGKPLIRMNEPNIPDGWETIKTEFGNLSAPVEILDDVRDALGMLNDSRQMGAVQRAFHAWNQSWAGYVTAALIGTGFHSRNMIGNVMNNALAGVTDPLQYARAMRIQAKGKQVRKLMSESGYSWDRAARETLDEADYAIVKAARAQGIVSSSLFSDLGELRTPKTKTGMAVSKAVGVRNPLVTSGRKFGSAIENNARLTHFMTKLDAGLGVEAAAQSTRKYLFDYQDLTKAERGIKDNVSRFYTWMRKNTPLQLETLFTRPGVHAAGARIEEAALGGGEGDLAGYQTEEGMRPADEGLASFLGFDAAVGVSTPLDSAMETLQPVLTGGALTLDALGLDAAEGLATRQDLVRDILGMTSGAPIAAAEVLVENLTGIDTFTGHPIRWEDLDAEDQLLKMSNPLLPAWQKVDRLIGNTFDDGIGPVGNELSERASENNWKGSLMKELLGVQLTPAGTSDAERIEDEIAEIEANPALEAKLDIFVGDYDTNKTNTELAKELGTSASTVGRYKNEAITINSYLAGATVKQIVEANPGWTAEVVAKRIREFETPGSTLRTNMMAAIMRDTSLEDLLSGLN